MSYLSASHEVQKSPEYSALHKYITGRLQNLGDAQDAFCEQIEDKYMAHQNPSEVEELLWVAWRGVIAAAADVQNTADQRHKIAQFVISLQQRPTLEKDGQVCEVQGMTMWKDLPIFGWVMREAWNFTAKDNVDEHSKQQWINLNSWSAVLLASAHSKTHDKPDQSLFCVWSLREGLEQSDKPSNVALSAAAIWLINAPRAIWEFCNQDKTFDGKIAAPGNRFNDRDWSGFTGERWRAWAQSLSNVCDQTSDHATRQLVKQASEAMASVVKS